MKDQASETLDLSIIVVSYNTREMTLDCLDSVFRETRETRFELIVLDNASADGSAEAIRARFPQVELIALEENLGFARANNVAAERARGRRLLLLNPDTVVLDGAIDRLMAFAEARPEARIWGGRTLFGDGSLNPRSCARRMTPWGLFCNAFGLNLLLPNNPLFNYEHYGGWRRDDEREVDIVIGCFLLIDNDFWRRLSGFDLDFVMYGEEADLCLRARTLGARPRITPDAVIIHYGGASETVRADKMVRLFKAKVTLIRKHWSYPTRPIGVWLFAMWPYSRHLAAAVLRRLGRSEENLKAWSEVWRRRGEWRAGY